MGRARREALRGVPAGGRAGPAAPLPQAPEVAAREVRADQVGVLAGKLALPRAALSGEDGVVMVGADPGAKAAKVPVRPFRDPDPFRELGFANPIAARRAIADEVRLPLAKLSDDDRAFIDALLARTLARPEILAAVRERFPLGRKGGMG